MNGKEVALKACPACRKHAGTLRAMVGARFPFYVLCRACGFTTASARLEGVALKLWNEAKLANAVTSG